MKKYNLLLLCLTPCYRTLIILLAGLINQAAYSDNKQWYQIEVLAFEHLQPQWREHELWEKRPHNSFEYDIPPPPKPLWGSLDLSTQHLMLDDPRLHLSAKKDYKLSYYYKKMRASKHYKPVFHTAWKQPGLSFKQSKSLHVSLPLENGNILAGYLSLSRGRFLHLAFDLYYPGCRYDKNNACQSVVYPLKTSRKMRRNELHYVDSPVLAALVYASPVASPYTK